MADKLVSDDERDAAMRAGAEAAEAVAGQGPDDPLLAISWALGFGQVDQLRAAVDRARQQGLTWRQIASATGEHVETARTKYGGGLERMRRYRDRKRSE